MKIVLALLAMLIFATNVIASDSIGIGIREGAATDRETSNFVDVFADLYLNRIVSIGASASYVMPNRDHINSIQHSNSEPVTALFKLHAPTPVLQPYAGLGEALEFHNKYGPTGTPVALIGLDFPIGPFFLNAEYRRQFNDMLNFVSVGAGIRF
ncbi:MAG: hypothetical protein P4L44_12105 [Oryzomonas sp.]|uniref:hypothetical protein n=1 Tax=Oryzomonas sp. TaxID=2855186 RepID=UPI002847F5E5|nr:hypothetical protein [Oryzomonas sp.]MDR3580696.1 hypothetical protein [Oryzomonas sp.]